MPATQTTDESLNLLKLEKRAEELGRRRYSQMTEITPLQYMEDKLSPDEVHCDMPDFKGEGSLSLGDIFKGFDKYLWIDKTLELPKAKPGFDVVGLFDFGKTGNGHNSGFESLLYIDAMPYQAVDSNHMDVMLNDYAGKSARLTFMLWTGLRGGRPHEPFFHIIQKAHTGYLHRDTNELYYLLNTIAKTLPLLPESEPGKHLLAAAADKALKLINWDDDKLVETVPKALALLKNELAAIEKHSDVTVHCIGHTHIDVAWLWRLKHTREKAIRSFSTVLRLMEEYDDYVFLQTQPQLYSYIKSDCPELYAKIKERVKQGRWEVDGGMWLEADCNTTSGESLVRQLLFGTRFIESELGKACEYLWLPDVFGYSAALPQILRLCNIKTFFTSKISWNQYNTMPNDLFLWKGIDGSEVLTYFLTTPDVNAPLDSRFATYNGELEPRTVTGAWQRFKNKNISDNVLVSYGYGDGGGGVNRHMLEMRRTMDKLPMLPNVKQTHAGKFFSLLHNDIEANAIKPPKWDGELYLEYHRGTYTTQAKNKKANRKLEFMLAESEWLCCLAQLEGQSYDSEALNSCWQVLLRNQFHDIIPGSSISEVYKDSAAEYEQAFEKLSDLRTKALLQLTGESEHHFTLCNFSSFSRRDVVFIPTRDYGFFKDASGNTLPAQKSENGYHIEVQLEPLSMSSVCFEQGIERGIEQAQEAAFIFNPADKSIESAYYNIRWDELGRLESIFDKENCREIIAGGEYGNALEIFEDKPINYEAWDIDAFYIEKKELPCLAEEPSVLANGPLFCTIRFVYIYNKSRIEQDMTLYSHNRRIDFSTKVDWHESHRLLKTAFSVDIRSAKASYDIQFGYLERPVHSNTSWEAAQFECVGHKWADLSETGYGVSLLNDSKYGYSIKENTMRLSLLRSPKYPDETADMGTHEFTYSLLPHNGSFIQGGTIQAATSLNIPVIVKAGSTLQGGKSIFRISSDHVNIDAAKRSEDGECVILRLHECHGGRANIDIESDYGIKKFAECNLLEQGYAVPIAQSIISTVLKPFEIKTFRIWL